ncbi:MAG TPA: membrane protein insertase YidC [Burkholderiales bacterium]|nr:membrane protein insertase YidC [Burkholderiales bacterium]
MDSRRLIIFIALSLGLLLIWEKYFTPPQNTKNASREAANIQPVSSNQITSDINSNNFNLINDKTIMVTTNLMQAQISTVGGDIRGVELLKHGSLDNVKRPYELLQSNNNHLLIAQTGLVSNNNISLPTHNTIFMADKYSYVLEPQQNTINAVLKATESSGVEIIKTLTFKRDSYIVNVNYKIINNSNQPIAGVSAYWRLLRDDKAPEGETKFVHTFTGPAYYTADAKFNTIKFDSLAKNDISYIDITNNGWVGFVQHYFSTLWLLNAYNYPSVCTEGVKCRLNFKAVGNNLASSGFLTDLPIIQPHTAYSISVPLFVGPQEYNVLLNTAPHLELIKDYGWVYIFATPLFWLLVKLFEFVRNWGYAIILLTIVVKMILYPLTRASYISMAKMKVLAPKMEKLKAQYATDKTKLQRAMMELYKSEKVNPIGGCLPMLLQIPVFIGLYWALLSSVELRQASFLWIQDLSRPDPYYILPIILAITMFLQTFLNPPPTDPVQAKMMKIMPVAFSVMFFFFPAGLVLYWLVNNILSMTQQWYVNNHVVLRKKNRDNK